MFCKCASSWHNWTTFPSLSCNLVWPLTEFWPIGYGWEQYVLLSGPENLLGASTLGVSVSFLYIVETVCLKTLVKQHNGRSLGSWIRAQRRASWWGKLALITSMSKTKTKLLFCSAFEILRFDYFITLSDSEEQKEDWWLSGVIFSHRVLHGVSCSCVLLELLPLPCPSLSHKFPLRVHPCKPHAQESPSQSLPHGVLMPQLECKDRNELKFHWISSCLTNECFSASCVSVTSHWE